MVLSSLTPARTKTALNFPFDYAPKATRLGAEEIPVYEVRPGVIKTDMAAGVTEKYDKLIAGGLNIQPRWGFPADVGNAVAALVRGDFSFSTGKVIMADGGMIVPRL